MNPPLHSADTAPYASFWMGGFEGADHINGHGLALDLAVATGHIDQIEDDHRRAAEFGIRTVRESIGWRLTESAPGHFDLERACRIARSARRHGLQVLWTLMHYGTPADVSMLDDALCDRFVRFATAVADALGPLGDRPPVYNLINEISFVAWAVTSTNLIHPYRGDPEGRGEHTESSGFEVKRRLVRASLAAMAAIRRTDPGARFLHIDPLVHVVTPPDRPELAGLAARVAAYQWQAWDMLAGRSEPQLGGHPGALDLIGVNHYHSGQWEVSTEQRLLWHRRDQRRRPLGDLLLGAWDRYRRPLIVAETSHVGEGRGQWLNEVASEVQRARAAGVPVDGICLYPLVDRPDWNDAAHWHHSGLWDVEKTVPADSSGTAGVRAVQARRRVLCTGYAEALQSWQTRLPKRHQQGPTMTTTLIVFSHLRWSFVYQRPQHLLSRLARHYRVVFVEEPMRSEGSPRLDRISHGPDLDVLVPHTPVDAVGFHDDQLPLLEPLLAGYLRDNAIDDYVVWFYTPMALPLLTSLQPRAVVYDCMDELSAFKQAPRQLRQREAALLKRADLVLTGGPALYESKRHLHSNAHCLPSSVDAGHFSPDRLDPAAAHAVEAERLHGAIGRPRLGFFGVIDERFDIGLLGLLADSHPEWHLVMVGPVVKIDAADLPQRPNIHWLGMQSYDRLPHLVSRWDVCLMPFAINEATRFISPTKTLEYMAAQKPIVGTPVHDVIALYGDTVRIAAAGPEFVAACEQALGEDRMRRNRRIGEMLATVQRSSWDRTADTVHKLLETELRKSPLRPATLQAA